MLMLLKFFIEESLWAEKNEKKCLCVKMKLSIACNKVKKIEIFMKDLVFIVYYNTDHYSKDEKLNVGL
jgi:hypothetical protein